MGIFRNLLQQVKRACIDEVRSWEKIELSGTREEFMIRLISKEKSKKLMLDKQSLTQEKPLENCEGSEKS